VVASERHARLTILSRISSSSGRGNELIPEQLATFSYAALPSVLPQPPLSLNL